MSYTPTTWTTGDTITATKLNKIEQGIADSGGGGYDAVIRLTHGDDSGADTPSNLTPSIVSGSYANLYAKCDDGECPFIHIEYCHPWGMFASLDGVITYFSVAGIRINPVGYYPVDAQFKSIAPLAWLSNDTIIWET